MRKYCTFRYCQSPFDWLFLCHEFYANFCFPVYPVVWFHYVDEAQCGPWSSEASWSESTLFSPKKMVLSFEKIFAMWTFITIENVNTINKHRSKIVRNRVFDCHLSPVWRQMAIENTVTSDFFFYLHSSIVKNLFDCRLSGAFIEYHIRFFFVAYLPFST